MNKIWTFIIIFIMIFSVTVSAADIAFEEAGGEFLVRYDNNTQITGTGDILSESGVDGMCAAFRGNPIRFEEEELFADAGALAISVWLKTDGAQNSVIFDCEGLNLSLSGENLNISATSREDDTAVLRSFSIPMKQWFHLAVGVNYKDGAVTAFVGGKEAIAASAQKAYFKSRVWAHDKKIITVGEGYTGWMDELKITKSVLKISDAAAEIDRIKQLKTGVKIEISFMDIEDNWAEKSIVKLASEGILSGKSRFIFDPEGKMTRAEFLSVCARLMNLQPQPYGGEFQDVSADNWYADAVAMMYHAGIIPKEILTGGLKPEQNITREEAAAIAYLVFLRLVGKKVAPAPKEYTDSTDIAGWAKEFIAKATKEQIIRGDENGAFNPQAQITRADGAQLIVNLKNRLDYHVGR